jgi:hypothetical protein
VIRAASAAPAKPPTSPNRQAPATVPTTRLMIGMNIIPARIHHPGKDNESDSVQNGQYHSREGISWPCDQVVNRGDQVATQMVNHYRPKYIYISMFLVCTWPDGQEIPSWAERFKPDAHQVFIAFTVVGSSTHAGMTPTGCPCGDQELPERQGILRRSDQVLPRDYQ